jgi:hypothetical protein
VQKQAKKAPASKKKKKEPTPEPDSDEEEEEPEDEPGGCTMSRNCTLYNPLLARAAA